MIHIHFHRAAGAPQISACASIMQAAYKLAMGCMSEDSHQHVSVYQDGALLMRGNPYLTALSIAAVYGFRIPFLRHQQYGLPAVPQKPRRTTFSRTAGPKGFLP